MYGAPEVWHALCGRLAAITLEFLRVQAAAGVARGAALRLLGRRTVRGRLPPVRAATLHRRSSVRLAAEFPTSRESTLESGRASCWPRWPRPGATVVGVDWRTPLDVAAAPGRPRRTRCRATSTRACCSRRGRSSRRRSVGYWPRAPHARANLQPRPRRAARDRPRHADPGRRPGPRPIAPFRSGIRRLTPGPGVGQRRNGLVPKRASAETG